MVSKWIISIDQRTYWKGFALLGRKAMEVKSDYRVIFNNAKTIYEWEGAGNTIYT